MKEGNVNQALRDRLVDVARAQQTVTYGELGSLLKLDMANPADRNRIAELLGEVSRFEVSEGRPMLSSIVIHKDGSSPGHGFFVLAIELGKAASVDDELAFCIQEMNRTLEYWARH